MADFSAVLHGRLSGPEVRLFCKVHSIVEIQFSNFISAGQVLFQTFLNLLLKLAASRQNF